MTQTYNTRTETRETRPPALIAWHVGERDGKNFWTRIGAAWNHRDGEGFALHLDLVPVGTGRIVLRTPTAAETAAGA